MSYIMLMVFLLFIISLFVLIFLEYRIKSSLIEKAQQSQKCYNLLQTKHGLELNMPVAFKSSTSRIVQLFMACFQNNPFPKSRLILLALRLIAVVKLFKKETVLQTAPAAAALTACSSLATDIACLREYPINPDQGLLCDVLQAGFQAVRLYFVCSYQKEFSLQRYQSVLQVNNAFNGSRYKYKTVDNRHYSFHVYYPSQKQKMVTALGIQKPADEFMMGSTSADKKLLQDLVGQLAAHNLEEITFQNGASGCVLRDRDEWKKTEVGKAVGAMPLFRLRKMNEGRGPHKYGAPTLKKGPLSGIKVLDLTHIIAGPACSRLLAQYGADVLLIRRGDFDHQGQSFLELDGWAGKHACDLDFNVTEDLARMKRFIAEADIVVNSYQEGALDRFGLSEDEIFRINPNVIYSNLICFSDTIWKNRPGWAPLAEDITGLSIRNGSLEKPKNLNGVPLDYIPGFILALGTLEALKQSITI